jgi:HEPN domain-containing protein
MTARLQDLVADALASHRISRVRPNTNRSGDLVNQARRHLDSARLVASTDSTLALAACHDAVRKSVDALAGAMGYRFENKPGAHRTALEYGRLALEGDVADGDWEEADRLRSRRHSAEYGEVPSVLITAQEIEHYSSVAERITRAVAEQLARAGRRSSKQSPGGWRGPAPSTTPRPRGGTGPSLG